MLKCCGAVILVSLSFLIVQQSKGQDAKPKLKQNEIPARVDERVELLSIVFRLAKANEYSQAPDSVPYVKAVDEYFKPYKDHAAIKLALKLRAERGIGFDAVASFAVHLKGGPKLLTKIALDNPKLELEKRWSVASAKEFLTALQSFVDDSKAFEFFEENRELYQKSAERLAKQVAQRPYKAWLDDYFGEKAAGTEFCAIVGMLNGGGNYGMKVRYPDGHEEILPIIGAAFDKEGIAQFEDSDSALVAHEFCHSYCNPLVDQFAGKLMPSAEKIFPRRENLLRPQAYSNARTMMYESLVRACTHRFLVKHAPAREAAKQLYEEVGRGFFWTKELSQLLEEYERSRDKYKTLTDFMPRIVEFFDKLAKDIDSKMAKLPKIVKVSPANGSEDVDPDTKEIVIEFDRPMNKRGKSIVSNPKNMPVFEKGGGFSDDGKTFKQNFKLEPGKTYTYSLNSLYFSGFASEEGLPLDPVPIKFTTSKK